MSPHRPPQFHGRSRRGFTLLEVMVSVAILGLGLTAILSAQANAFAASAHARDISQANGLLQCKMVEVEEQLLRDGLPELDVDESGPCCAGTYHPRMVCSWRVETPELPEPALGELDLDTGMDLGGLGPLASLGGSDDGGGRDDGSPPSASDLTGVASELAGGGEEGEGGAGDIYGMLLGMVYPDVKPIFEASIRRIVVTVTWKRGATPRTQSLTQWYVVPQPGVSDLEASALGDQVDQLLGGDEDEGGGTSPGGGNGGPAKGGLSPLGGGR